MEPQNRHLVVGLGNPGAAYEHTRHNAGFMAVDQLAAAFSISMASKKRFPHVAWGQGVIQGVRVVLAKPLAYMNRSGPPLKNLALYFDFYSDRMVVIHDDIDLAFGRIKIIEKGGHGGHNGVRSLIDAFGANDFTRLRIGIGRSETRTDVSDHVLGKFNSRERSEFDRIIERAADAAVTVLTDGPKAAMNQFNRK